MDTQTDTKVKREERDSIFREAATAAAAKGTLKTIQNLFAEVDGDGNGVINEAELECLILMVFDRLAPAGAQISPGELRATATEVTSLCHTHSVTLHHSVTLTLPHSVTLSLSLCLTSLCTHSLSLVLIVMMRSTEFKTSRSILMLIL